MQNREKAFSRHDQTATSTPSAEPTEALLQIHCESDQDFAPADGVVGKSCVARDSTAKPQVAGKGVPIGKRHPVTFSLWLRPESRSIRT